MSDSFDKLFSLHDQVAIVTGSSRGIGAVLANGLSDAGAKVVGLARSESPSSELSKSVDFHQCDISNENSFQSLCGTVFERYGSLTILINAAGISLSNDDSEKQKDIFEKTLAVDLVSPFTCSMAARKYMSQSGQGSIVNITSINSIVGFPGNPGYVAAKGGLRMLTRSLAIDLIGDNIRVNAIAPGYIQTDMTKKSFSDPELYEDRLRHMIIPRWGKPEDLVGAAIFLCSSASSYITGQDVIVDGGWTAKGLT